MHLPLDLVTFAEQLKRAGYTTGYFGKWHLGRGEFGPQNQGFDQVTTFEYGSYFNIGKSLNPPQEFAPDKILSEALTDFSIQFLEENKSSPFLLFLSHYDVHVQLEAQSELIEKYLQKPSAANYPSNVVYAAMIENLDASVGRVMAKLDALGLRKNTLVVFYSDNGGLDRRFDEANLLADSVKHVYESEDLGFTATSNAPLKSGKGSVYEGGIRVPLIVNWPGKIASGALSSTPVSGADFYPTLLDIAGLEDRVQVTLDGHSLQSLLFQQAPLSDRPLFWHYPVYHHNVPRSAVRVGNLKLIENLQNGNLQLFDLSKDLSESADISKAMPEKVREMHALLQSWREEVNAAMPRSNPNFDPAKRDKWVPHPELIKLIENAKKSQQRLP